MSPNIYRLATACTQSHTCDMFMHFYLVIFTLVRHKETENWAHKV
jgi:hypothetical protein